MIASEQFQQAIAGDGLPVPEVIHGYGTDSTGAPSPDTPAVLAALHALFTPDDVIELRAFPKGRKRTDAGYFDGQHWQQLAEHAARLSASGAAVYVTLNPVDPQLLSRYSNRIENFAQTTTTDKQVTRRRWLLVDIDPVRPSGTSATDAQLAAAKAKARAVYGYLNGMGWPAPLVAESGNGMHLLYAIDLPNDDEATALVKAVLIALGERFDDAQTKVDRAVFNAARICKLYGTLANKGDNTPMAPWRLSKLLQTPARAVVTPEQLQSLIPAATNASTAPTTPTRQPGGFNLEDFLSRHGLAYTIDRHDGSDRFKLAACPFNAEHGNGEAAIFRKASEALGFKCQHDSCSAKTWRDVRDLLDGPRPTRPQGGHTVRRGETFPSLEGVDDSDAAPEPLRAPLPPAEHYPVDALGDVLGGAARALHGSVKAPLALCAQSVLAAASLAAQAHYDVRLPWGQRKPLALFLLTVGESGERKSAVDDVVLGAAKAREKTEMAEYQLAMEEYESAMAAWNKATEAARTSATQGKKGTATAQQIREAVELAGDKPTAPIAPLRFVTDPTAEGLYKLLAMSQPSVALFSDEGGLLIGGHALNGDNFLKTITRWSKMWDGAPFDRVRAGDGIGILYGRRMALHQLAQGDVMVKLLSDRLANGQGLLARCLVAWPESTIGTRHTEAFEWAGDRRELKRLFGVLSSLMEAAPRTSDHSEQELDPIELPLSPEATAMALQAGNRFEALMASGNDLCELRDRTAKALENACRIAGVLVAIEQGMAARQIEADHLGRALVLVQWYLAEALRIRGAAAVPQAVQDAEALSRWLQGRGIAMFRTHAALNAGPAQLRNKARLMAAIEQLVETGYLVANPAGTEVEGVKARKSWWVLHHVV